MQAAAPAAISMQRASNAVRQSGGMRTQRCVIALLMGLALASFGWRSPLDPRLRREALAAALPERGDLRLRDGALWWQEGPAGPAHAVRWDSSLVSTAAFCLEAASQSLAMP